MSHVAILVMYIHMYIHMNMNIRIDVSCEFMMPSTERRKQRGKNVNLDSKVGKRLCRGFAKIPGIDAKLQHHRTIHTGGAPVAVVPGCTH